MQFSCAFFLSARLDDPPWRLGDVGALAHRLLGAGVVLPAPPRLKIRLPASSSYTLIGSIIGVGVANALLHGRDGTSGVDWAQATKVGYSLLLSPLVGFCCAALLLLALRAIVKSRELYEEPRGERPPLWWIRGLLVLTCTGVSFAHGSNDGQKGMGLIMLILVGTVPTAYALNRAMPVARTAEFVALAQATEHSLQAAGGGVAFANPREALSAFVRTRQASPEVVAALAAFKGGLDEATRFIPTWVKVAVAVALGLGTMVGWKRIVVTVGEKIGKTHLTYAQGACAEITAAATIAAADGDGLPVSTTHVLSSGIAGTMAANGSGLQWSTVRNIATAWVLTLPIAMMLSGLLYYLFVQIF